jgi:hypothetical protein
LPYSLIPRGGDFISQNSVFEQNSCWPTFLLVFPLSKGWKYSKQRNWLIFIDVCEFIFSKNLNKKSKLDARLCAMFKKSTQVIEQMLPNVRV